jgi:hypothetical protein
MFAAVVKILDVGVMLADESNGNSLASIPLKVEKCSEFETLDVADYDVALVLCSCGSTVMPKGIALSHMLECQAKSFVEQNK